MPTDHARKKTIRHIQDHCEVSYTDAARIERDPRAEALCDVLASGSAETYEEAVAVLEDPLNKILCEDCQWIVAWVCPECPGCGCYSHLCTGSRHAEIEEAYGDPDPIGAECGECGADVSTGSYDECMCHEFA